MMYTDVSYRILERKRQSHRWVELNFGSSGCLRLVKGQLPEWHVEKLT